MTHICVGKLTIIGSDNDLSPERLQAIIWTNAGILLIGPLEENTFENVVCEMLFISSRPQCVKVEILLIFTYDMEVNDLLELRALPFSSAYLTKAPRCR